MSYDTRDGPTARIVLPRDNGAETEEPWAKAAPPSGQNSEGCGHRASRGASGSLSGGGGRGRETLATSLDVVAG